MSEPSLLFVRRTPRADTRGLIHRALVDRAGLPKRSEMLSSLPIELLRKIIESTVPHSFREETYGGRQTTLCTLSLVSRQFCAIAEPLLKEVIWIEYAKHLDSLRSGEVARISGGIDRVRWAAVDGDIDQFWGPGKEERTRLETLRRILALAEAVTLLGMLQDFVDFAWPQSTPLSSEYL